MESRRDIFREYYDPVTGAGTARFSCNSCARMQYRSTWLGAVDVSCCIAASSSNKCPKAGILRNYPFNSRRFLAMNWGLKLEHSQRI